MHSCTISPHLEFKNGVTGLGGYALSAITPGTKLVTCPYSSILSETYAEDTIHGRAAISALRSQHPLEVSGRTVLYLVMMAEYARSPGSTTAPAFHEYLRSLPERYDDPLWWREEECAELLQGTNLHHAVGHRMKWLHRIYDACFPALTLAHPDLFPAHHFTFARFMWAHSAFSSRGFPHILSVHPSSSGSGSGSGSKSSLLPSPPSQVDTVEEGGGEEDINPLSGRASTGPVGCMLPIVDILNHAPRTAVTWQRGEEGVVLVAGLPHATNPGEFTGPTLPSGAEVCNNYGPKSNEELLLAFGFVIPGNADDIHVLKLKLPALGEGGGAAKALNIPERHVCGGASGSSSGGGGGGGGGLPASLMAAARLGTCSEERLNGILAALSGSQGGACKGLLFSPQPPLYEERALHSLHTLLHAKHSALLAHHPWLNDPEKRRALIAPFSVEEATSLTNASQAPTSQGESGGAFGGGGVSTITTTTTTTVEQQQEQPFPPPVPASIIKYREWMSRVYVEGQGRILQECIGQVKGLLEGLWVDGASSTSSTTLTASPPPLPMATKGAPQDSFLPPMACSIPGSTCAMYLPPPPSTGSNPTAEEGVTGGWEGWGEAGASPVTTLLSLPSSTLLCPANFHSISPSLASALESVEGLRVPATVGDCEEGEEMYAKVTSRLQCALLLLAEGAAAGGSERRGGGRGGGGGGKKRKGEGGGVVGGKDKKECEGEEKEEEEREGGKEDSNGEGQLLHFQRIKKEFITWAKRVFARGGTGEGLERVYFHATFMASPVGGIYHSLFPALSHAFPKLFPPSHCKERDWEWACRVVRVCGIPLHPYGAVGVGAPLQCCIPLLFPLVPPFPLPTPSIAAGSGSGSGSGGGGGGGSEEKEEGGGEEEEPCHTLPLGVKWSTAASPEGVWMASLKGSTRAKGSQGGRVLVNPSSPCSVSEGRGVPSQSFPLPVPTQLTWLMREEEEEEVEEEAEEEEEEEEEEQEATE